MHFDDWDDADFQSVLDIVQEWESTGDIPKAPAAPRTVIPEEDPVEKAVRGAHELFSMLEHDDQVDALNSLAVLLGVMDPEDT